MSEKKFKPGDKVIYSGFNYPKNAIGTIIATWATSDILWTVQWNNNGELFESQWHQDNIKLAIPYLNEQKLKEKLGL